MLPAFRHPASQSAERVETCLGDPLSTDNRFSFAQIVEWDEREEFPSQILESLIHAGVQHLLIPRELGGELRSFEESIFTLRAVARRDLTAAIAFGQTFLGAIPIWLAGSESQKQTLASCIRKGGLGALALTEEAHGGDLAASEFTAELHSGAYLLSGRKWLINNGSRGEILTVFARTGNAPAFSLIFFEKAKHTLSPNMSSQPKIRTHGIRGADISGFMCSHLPVPAEALVGGSGSGYEITLKTLQISRTMCAALSLGAADTALRCAFDFALHRNIFNTTVAAIPSAREQLIQSYGGLLLCECLAHVSARAIQCFPHRLAAWSAVVKYLVPTVVEDLVRQSAVVLGARHYLRESHWSGVFQKVMRDHAVVGLFDGSTAVNLHVLSGQLVALTAKRKSAPPATRTSLDQLRPLFDVKHELPWTGFPKLASMKFTNDGFDEIVHALPAIPTELHRPTLSNLVSQLQQEVDAIDSASEAAQGTSSFGLNSPLRFLLAKRYCALHAAAVCLLFWHFNREHLGSFFESADWLVLALHRLLTYATGNVSAVPDAVSNAAYQQMLTQFENNRLLSLFHVPLAPLR